MYFIVKRTVTLTMGILPTVLMPGDAETFIIGPERFRLYIPTQALVLQ